MSSFSRISSFRKINASRIDLLHEKEVQMVGEGAFTPRSDLVDTRAAMARAQ